MNAPRGGRDHDLDHHADSTQVLIVSNFLSIVSFLICDTFYI